MKVTSQAIINGKYTYKLAWTRARKLKAIPRCSSSRIARGKILSLYVRAQVMNLTSNTKYEVDHIIPLYHPDICGLHCVANLQILPKASNQAKSNKFAPYREKNGKRFYYKELTWTDYHKKLPKKFNRTKKNPLKLVKKRLSYTNIKNRKKR